MDQQESLGSYLRRERKKRDISLEQISYATRISTKMLLALEEDIHHELPAQPFVRGYLQAYAKYLKLDAKDVLLRYQHHLAVLAPQTVVVIKNTLEEEKEHVDKKKYALYLVAAFAVILSAALFIWLKKKFYSENLYAVKAPILKTISNSKPAEQPAVTQEIEKSSKEPTSSTNPITQNQPAVPPTVTKQAPPVATPKPAPPAITPTPTPPPAAATAVVDTSSNKTYNLSLTGKEDVWIRYQTDTDEIKDMMVRKEKTIILHANKIIKIFTGNPRGLVGKLNGAELESLILDDWKRSIVIPFSEKPNVTLPLFPGSNDNPSTKPKENKTTP